MSTSPHSAMRSSKRMLISWVANFNNQQLCSPPIRTPFLTIVILYLAFSSVVFSDGAIKSPLETMDAKKCEAVQSIQAAVLNLPKFPQYSHLVHLLADRGSCQLKLTTKQKGVCKKTAEFNYCCSEQYEQALQRFFVVQECLMGLVVQSSVLEGIVAEPHGAIPRSIKRLQTARADVPSDTGEVYRASMNLLNEILYAVNPMRDAAQAKSFGDALESVRFFFADMMCGICSPTLVSSVKSGNSMVVKVNLQAFQTLQYKIEKYFRKYLEVIAWIFHSAQVKDGWIDRALTIRIQHFLLMIRHLAEDLSSADEDRVGQLLQTLKTISSTYQYLSEEPITDQNQWHQPVEQQLKSNPISSEALIQLKSQIRAKSTQLNGFSDTYGTPNVFSQAQRRQADMYGPQNTSMQLPQQFQPQQPQPQQFQPQQPQPQQFQPQQPQPQQFQLQQPQPQQFQPQQPQPQQFQPQQPQPQQFQPQQPQQPQPQQFQPQQPQPQQFQPQQPQQQQLQPQQPQQLLLQQPLQPNKPLQYFGQQSVKDHQGLPEAASQYRQQEQQLPLQSSLFPQPERVGPYRGNELQQVFQGPEQQEQKNQHLRYGFPMAPALELQSGSGAPGVDLLGSLYPKLPIETSSSVANSQPVVPPYEQPQEKRVFLGVPSGKVPSAIANSDSDGTQVGQAYTADDRLPGSQDINTGAKDISTSTPPTNVTEATHGSGVSMERSDMPLLLASKGAREVDLATNPLKFKERLRTRLINCASDLGLFATDDYGVFTGYLSTEGFKEKFEPSISELSMHDFIVTFGLGPQLCVYDLMVNILALLPDPRVDGIFSSQVRAENGTLISGSGEKTVGSQTMKNLARGILATLENEMSTAVAKKMSRDDILLINEKGELVRNRTLLKLREKRETDAFENEQLKLQKQAIEEYKKHQQQVQGNESDGAQAAAQENMSSLIQTAEPLITRDVVAEFIDESENYYRRHGLQPATPQDLYSPTFPSNEIPAYPSSTENLSLLENVALLEYAISFAQTPEQKNVMVFFSSDAPDPSDTSEHQRISQDLDSVVCQAVAICFSPASVLCFAVLTISEGGKSVWSTTDTIVCSCDGSMFNIPLK